jgi:adenosylcobinamide hydrolase
MNLPIPGVEVSITEEAVWVSSQQPLTAISSAILGGGLSRVNHIINLHVDKDYSRPDPEEDLTLFAYQKGITTPFIGLMTAANTRQARAASELQGGLAASALITLGLSNACSAGITPPAPHISGTINLIVLVDANPTPAALVNAVITATEVKCDLLRRHWIRASDGEPATGTSTDAIVIAATGRGDRLPYGGPTAPLGWLIARAVRQAMEAAFA